MQCLVHCRVRSIVLFSFITFLLLLTYIIWPWVDAAVKWQNSTINALNLPIVSALNNTDKRVPPIIHQTWRDADTIPISWQQASNTCRSLHSNYEYRLWTNAAARQLIESEFPCLLSTYDSYLYDIQRADVIRLIVLYLYGGIYLDFDIVCLKSLDQLRIYNVVLPRTMPVGLSNDFIVAEPRNPFLLQVLNDLPKANRNYITKYPTVMFSTGPMFLTYEASIYADRSSINVLSQELYGKYIQNSSQALFQHLKASSWHGNDAAIVKWIYHQRIMLFLCLITSLLLMFTIVCFCSKHQSLSSVFFRSCSIGKSKLTKQPVKYEKIHTNPIFI